MQVLMVLVKIETGNEEIVLLTFFLNGAGEVLDLIHKISKFQFCYSEMAHKKSSKTTGEEYLEWFFKEQEMSFVKS